MPERLQFIPIFRCMNKVIRLILKCDVILWLAQRLGTLELGKQLLIKGGCPYGCKRARTGLEIGSGRYCATYELLIQFIVLLRIVFDAGETRKPRPYHVINNSKLLNTQVALDQLLFEYIQSTV